MSAGSNTGSKQFIIAANGDLLNVDGVRRIFVSGTAVMANMTTGPDQQLLLTPEQMGDLRRLLGINAGPV